MDNQAAQVWLQQEGAFHLGMAVGVLLAQAGLSIPEEEVEIDEETRREREDAIRFGAHRQTDRRLQYDPDEEEKEEQREREEKTRTKTSEPCQLQLPIPNSQSCTAHRGALEVGVGGWELTMTNASR